jgi:hypothetical protein
MRYLGFVVLAVFSCIVTSHAQIHQQIIDDNNINFYDAVRTATAMYDSTAKETKGSGYKQLLRWQYRNESRFAPDGARNLVSPLFAQEQFEAFVEKNTNRSTRGFHSTWRELGSTDIDTITGHYAPGLGRLEDVWAFPTLPNRLYLGTRSGGFWRSNDGGLSWINTTDTLVASGVNAIAVSPTNPDAVLINVRNPENGYTHGIYKSTDGGMTWTVTPFNPANTGIGGWGSAVRINKVFYHPLVPNLVLLGTNQGLYRSTNDLQSWTQIMPSANITSIAFHPTNPAVVYMYDDASGSSFSNNVLVSTDTGSTFVGSATLSGNASATVFLSTTAACPSCIYAASTNGVWKSTNQGTNFALRASAPATIRGFAVDTYDTSKYVAGYVDLYNTNNGGDSLLQCTWWSLGSSEHGAGSGHEKYQNSSVYVHADCNNLKCINGVYYAATDGFFAKSTDNGETWTRLNNAGTGIRENYCLGTSQNNHWITMCGSQDNGESIHTKNGWIEFYGADGMEGIVHPLNEKYIIGSVQYGNRRRTRDGGYTQDDASPPPNGDWVAPINYDPLNPMRLYDFTDSIYVSDDFGSTWTFLHRPAYNANTNSAAIAENNSRIIAISSGPAIRKSVDAGNTFVSIKNTLPNYTITDIAFDPNDDNTIAVTYNRYQADNQKIFISKDGGATWQNITHNLGSMPLQSVVIDHSPQRNIYVGAEVGVFVKAMADTVWQLFNTGLPNVCVNELEICYATNTLKAATWGRGLWEAPLRNRTQFPAIVTTAITTPPTEQLPKANTEQTVTSRISYTGTITKCWVAWGVDTILLNNTINMANISDSTWQSVAPIPGANDNARVYFKVYAVGTNNDTTTTYRFMYLAHPRVYCNASGTTDGGDLYITNFSLANVNNTTANTTNQYFNNPIIDLYSNTVYTISVTANTGWSDNDYGAWIDFNGDTYFDKDNEKVLFVPNNGGSATSTFSLPAPANYYGQDTVRMRVRLSYWGASPDPCGTTMGEVEDYAVRMHWPTLLQSEQPAIMVYPNPVHDVLFVQAQTQDFEITNTLGQKQNVKANALAGATTCSIDVSSLTNGIYMLRSGNSFVKFVKN